MEDIVYVMAESEEDAINTARYESDGSAWRSEATIATKDNFDDSTGWRMNCIPFGEEEKTIDELI